MKKLISFLLILTTLFAFSFNAMATVEFTPSVTNKGAPDVVYTEEDNTVFGYMLDEFGNIIHKTVDDCFEIISFADIEKSTTLSDKEKELINKLYSELTDSDTNLSELCPDLNDIVKDKLGNEYDADDLVIRDYFDIDELCEEVKKQLPKDGVTLELTFDLSIGKNDFITAMVYIDGKWQVVPNIVNNGDGTVTVTFEEFGPVAFLVPGNTVYTSAPATGDTNYNSLILWSSVLVVSIGAIVFVICTSKKKKSDK